MPEKADRLWLSLLLLMLNASLAAADRIIQIPFQYAFGKESILVRVRINDKPVLVVLDTGFPNSTIRPEFFGLSADTNQAQHEALIQIGGWQWEKKYVIVRNLAQALSGYEEKLDGILGLDFFKEFSQVTINIKKKTITFVIEDDLPVSIPDQKDQPHFGNLSNLTFDSSDHRSALNGFWLPLISSPSVQVQGGTTDYKARITFLKTIRLSQGKSQDAADRALLDNWIQSIPLVAQTLKKQDWIASLEPVIYDLLESKVREGLELQEAIATLWTDNPADAADIGNPRVFPPVKFIDNQLVDIQYRGLKNAANQLFTKLVLQVLYILDHKHRVRIGAFLIVSRPDGSFQFYLIPDVLLADIIAD